MFIVALILGAAALYFVDIISSKRAQKEVSNKFNNEIAILDEKFKKEQEQRLISESEKIKQEINKFELMLNEKAEAYVRTQKEWIENIDRLRSKYENEKEQLTNDLHEHLTNKQNEMNEELLKEKEKIDNKLHILENNYNITVKDYEMKIENERKKYNIERTILNGKIMAAKNQVDNLIEQFKRDEEARQEKDFYRICISDEVKEDINKIKSIAAQLRNPLVLYKLIWKEYYESAFNQMCGRVLGENADKIGIYKITNTKNNMCYIGQTKAGFKNRWRTHSKRGVRAEESTNNRLYKAMWEEGLENFTFQIVEICEPAKLTEREKFFIDYYKSKEYGYNSKT